MSLFNFKLSKESYLKTSINLTLEMQNLMPEDYICFLKEYDLVMPENEEATLININDEPISININNFKDINIGYGYPKCYIAIATDYEFECVFMSLREEDKGHIYYMDLETWQDYVMGEPEDIQIKAIKEHAIHIANSFTEFCGMLYLED